MIDKYRITWLKNKAKNGFYSRQEVVVYGLDNVKFVMDNLVPVDAVGAVDIIPCL
ncbi:hypothetical protein CPRG_00033 [Synechococcus phage Syn30]|jgi:hypothetical protein|uniref:Uncharacterized protein n=1 Tax=Synechococcus phage Syn30 TaxID=536474 RepID=M4SIG4_9CAUD|nr:hypothetical protein CPRG_00033 [Synechococcus phage Syn30]AGH56117.1 hypothetical protein CPRG_00033 [Synechococcus phage Syn30]|tara:strand:+ start:2223 stop:2387 length:165 start_codon:yes stop_codon:yes gene_type:complete